MDNNEEKKCWACKRIIIGKSKVGLCPNCINKAGNGVATLGSIALTVGGGFLFKNGSFKKK